MKAKLGDHYATQRQQLHKIVPLETPLSLSIEPSTYCNLKCNFCIHSLSKEEIFKSGHVFGLMTLETFSLIVDQLKDFPRPIKSLSFIGTGEPLLNKDLAIMVENIKSNNLAENVIIVTNGTLLSHDLSKDLIEAGADTIKISVNGLSSEDYYNNCGVKTDFDSYLSEISFLYENKKNAKILIKTLSSALGDRSKNEFYQKFGDYCDVISVENTMPYFEAINYNNLIAETPSSRYDSVRKRVNICAAPFMRMGILYNGKVVICGCRAGISTEDMILYKNSLTAIWNGQQHKEILCKVIKQDYSGITEYCNNCTSRNDFAFEEDNLDPYGDEIYKKLYEGMKKNGM